MDQHTAHERVRFERIERALQGRRPESQLLLSPVVVALPPQLLPLLEAQTEALAALGYDAELFGGTSVRLRSVPALLAGRDPAPALESPPPRLPRPRGWRVDRGESGGASGRDPGLPLVGASRTGPGRGHHGRDRPGSPEDRAIRLSVPTAGPTSVRLPQEDVSRWFGRTGWKRQ